MRAERAWGGVTLAVMVTVPCKIAMLAGTQTAEVLDRNAVTVGEAHRRLET